MKIVIAGAGAIGGYIGARLARAAPPGDAAAGARPRAGAPRPGSASATGAAGTSAASGNVHVVARGDTLQKIARDRQVSVADLMKWNNIQDPRRLQIGQELRLAPPGG